MCADCGAEMKLRQSRYGPFYGCPRYPECDGKHGAHPNGDPLGVPAKKATREARQRAHAAFDELWRSGELSRGQAYKRLAEHMGVDEVHIGEMDEEQCDQVVAWAEEFEL